MKKILLKFRVRFSSLERWIFPHAVVFLLLFKHFESSNTLLYKNMMPHLNSTLTEAYKCSGGDVTEIISELML